jgi:hypothetical protein
VKFDRPALYRVRCEFGVESSIETGQRLVSAQKDDVLIASDASTTDHLDSRADAFGIVRQMATIFPHGSVVMVPMGAFEWVTCRL